MNESIESRTKSSAFSIAGKWAKWPAAVGFIVGVSGVMKGSGTLIGKILRSAILSAMLAIILGGITFLIVYVYLKLREW